MLTATPDEEQHVTDYMNGQAPDLKVEFIQKVYSEAVLSHVHDVWDVHTDVDRWWVITNPTNLYSQAQFPNMDLALTFHIGLCLRIPRSHKSKVSDLPIEPFAECYRYMSEADDALRNAREIADFQAVGVRCRETLLAFTNAAQMVVPWQSADPKPQKANFKAWAEHICNTIMGGSTHEHRRKLFKNLLAGAWDFSNWLTHTKTSTWHDAEAAESSVGHAVTLAVSAVIRHMRGVPEVCPACGSHRLSPERGYDSTDPEQEWERPTCTQCGWTGEPFPIFDSASDYEADNRPPPEGECVVPTVPLRTLLKPKRADDETH